jgi:hypothetical protein
MSLLCVPCLVTTLESAYDIMRFKQYLGRNKDKKIIKSTNPQAINNLVPTNVRIIRIPNQAC